MVITISLDLAASIRDALRRDEVREARTSVWMAWFAMTTAEMSLLNDRSMPKAGW